MYAAYNTALGYEMQDSIDTALEWALKAQTLAGADARAAGAADIDPRRGRAKNE